MTKISKVFSALRKKGRKAFIPYIMAGDPSLEETGRLVRLLVGCGADIIELGVPFSDPLADGPVIQRAAERALANGVTLRDVIAFVAEARKTVSVPIVLMTYYNPIFKYGEERFVEDATAAGVDGIIVPDLPPEEAGELLRLSRPKGLDLIFLLAPTSTDDRIKKVAKASGGFIYYVSITGITGSKLKLDDTMKTLIEGIRRRTGKPVAVGFGVSTPEEATAVSAHADGVIVGSAVVRKSHEEGAAGLERYLHSIRGAV